MTGVFQEWQLCLVSHNTQKWMWLTMLSGILVIFISWCQTWLFSASELLRLPCLHKIQLLIRVYIWQPSSHRDYWHHYAVRAEDFQSRSILRQWAYSRCPSSASRGFRYWLHVWETTQPASIMYPRVQAVWTVEDVEYFEQITQREISAQSQYCELVESWKVH